MAGVDSDIYLTILTLEGVRSIEALKPGETASALFLGYDLADGPFDEAAFLRRMILLGESARVRLNVLQDAYLDEIDARQKLEHNCTTNGL